MKRFRDLFKKDALCFLSMSSLTLDNFYSKSNCRVLIASTQARTSVTRETWQKFDLARYALLLYDLRRTLPFVLFLQYCMHDQAHFTSVLPSTEDSLAKLLSATVLSKYVGSLRPKFIIF